MQRYRGGQDTHISTAFNGAASYLFWLVPFRARTHTMLLSPRLPLFFAFAVLLLRTAPPAAAQAPDWEVNAPDFEQSMNLVGALFVDGLRADDPDDRIAAFAGDELRGVAVPTEVGNERQFFLTIYANGEGEQISFRAYDASAGRVLNVAETVVFRSNAVEGSPSAPFRLSAVTETSTRAERPAARFLPKALHIFPNPARDTFTLQFSAEHPGRVHVTLFDLQGRRLAAVREAAHGSGPQQLTLARGTLPAGRYLCRIEAGGRAATRMVVLH